MKTISLFLVLIAISIVATSANTVSSDTTKISQRIFRNKSFIEQKVKNTEDFKEFSIKNKDIKNDISYEDCIKLLKGCKVPSHYRKLISVQYENKNYAAIIILHICEGRNLQCLNIFNKEGISNQELIIHGNDCNGPIEISENKIIWERHYNTDFQKDYFTVNKTIKYTKSYVQGSKIYVEKSSTKYKISHKGILTKIKE